MKPILKLNNSFLQKIKLMIEKQKSLKELKSVTQTTTKKD